MLLEACGRLLFKDGRRQEQRSFVLNLTDSHTESLANLKKELLTKYGIPGWVSSCGVGEYTVKIGLKRLYRDEEYPVGRMVMADTEVEWTNICPLLSMTPKTHIVVVVVSCRFHHLMVHLHIGVQVN
jgi:hypothetical protein